ncbi:glutamate--cysteine ligase [Methanobrevibacter sp. 87.7]|uniref:glutamate--cysteine ligase n=1 Tax=Methanobrevibacter sp. 87.7 TaxID=387957 RepID=UPI000B50D22E|nr:glutamate--cysteine ligase [Methanobrevibacter sp. 87.7]OWT32767.1 glutamate--cysteine ligase [Methanobrevibacter sp. 87.7]
MDDVFSLSTLKEYFTGERLLEGLFGIEWEGLRTLEDGSLSLRPHPTVFGNKLTNPYITTDFSESQVEIITPAFNSVKEAFQFFSFISDLVNVSLDDDEFIWFQSLPCILPDSSKIPIAKYYGKKELAKKSMDYRKGLAKKYGLRKQLISGIHFNFSFKDEMVQEFYKHIIEDTFIDINYKGFKDSLYLKIARNYIKHAWFIIYLTGCSVAAHKSFTDECIKLTSISDNNGSFYTEYGPSLRNASCGYKNLEPLWPSYNNVKEFTRDVQSFVDKGILSEAKELYTQIRLKPKNPNKMLESLNEKGIQYLEVRTLDINPFYKCGLIQKDMDFLHLFLIYCLILDESDYENWQEEAILNEEKVAQFGYLPDLELLKDGKKVSFKDWGLEIFEGMEKMVYELDMDYYKPILRSLKKRFLNPSLTYGKRLLKLVKKEGFIKSQMNLSMNNKKTSQYIVNHTNLLNDDKFNKYVPIALQGKYSN